jgi:hypothetical protein
MTIETFVGSVLIVVAVWFAMNLLLWALQRYKTRLQSKVDALKAQALPKLPDTPTPSAEKWSLYKGQATGQQWFSAPCGQRLELGTTGFYIQLDTGNKAVGVYRGYTPEGSEVGSANYLPTVKKFVEELAAHRAEFAPPLLRWEPKA